MIIVVWRRYELAAVKPDWLLVAKGLIPNPVILKNPEMLYVAIGILGEQAPSPQCIASCWSVWATFHAGQCLQAELEGPGGAFKSCSFVTLSGCPLSAE